MPAVDLSGVRVVDNHCHGVDRDQAFDVPSWRRFFTESRDPVTRSGHVAESAFYRRLLRRMAGFHGVAADEESVLAARSAYRPADLVAALWRDARIGGIIVDTGFPPAETVLPPTQFGAAGGADTALLLRLELLFQDLVAAADSYDGLLDATRDRLADVRAAGFAGCKSIAAYRTGLDICRWDRPDAENAFAAARAKVAATGAVRLGHKPLLDTLLHIAFEALAAQELPLQFHCGYGDPDADLRTANPLLLRAVLEEPAYRAMPVVLLHCCWPYMREGAYLANMYGNAYFDLSYAIPFLSVGEMTSMTRAVLGAAPTSKLVYSSDGTHVPELHWMGAIDGRRVLGAVLGELIDDGDLEAADSDSAGEKILAGTSRRLYGLSGPTGGAA